MKINKRLQESMNLLHEEVQSVIEDNTDLSLIVEEKLTPAILRIEDLEMDIDVKNSIIQNYREFLKQYMRSQSNLKGMIKVSNIIKEETSTDGA